MSQRRLRVLVLCTGNSARSQMAEALFATLGQGRIEAASAGSRPAERVHPLAVATLAECGIEWSDRAPKGVDGLRDLPWDLVVTVCDQAREACPVWPGARTRLHWSLPDPAAVADDRMVEAFRRTGATLKHRIARLLALPLEQPAERWAAEAARLSEVDG